MPAAASGDRLAGLRALVAGKFPAPGERPALPRLVTGCAALDRQGGLRRGALTEICGSAAASQLALAALLEAGCREGFHLGLVDAAKSFEPADWPAEHLRRLLWVMGGEATAALKAADLLLRDGNLPLLVVDLQIVPGRELRRVPVSTWHRFHRVAAQGATCLVVLTPAPMIESVPTRVALHWPGSLAALKEPRSSLLARLEAQIFERGQAPAFTVLSEVA